MNLAIIRKTEYCSPIQFIQIEGQRKTLKSEPQRVLQIAGWESPATQTKVWTFIPSAHLVYEDLCCSNLHRSYYLDFASICLLVFLRVTR